jgi:hypothetical protein
MTDNDNRPMTGKGLRLRVTAQEHSTLKQEAEAHGYDLSTLLRLRIFGKVKGMRVIRRPSTDVMLLGDIIGRLTALTAELNKLGSNINQIAKRLNQGSRDVFGLDGALRLFEQVGSRVLCVLHQVEAVITGRTKSLNPNQHNEEK